jgi:hypothetical protein
MRLIHKPTQRVSPFYQDYIDKVPDDGKLLQHLPDILAETERLLSTLPPEKLSYSYAPGKWTIKDIIQHLSDCERVIIYRAMRMARRDGQNLPGFDEIFLHKMHMLRRGASKTFSPNFV